MNLGVIGYGSIAQHLVSALSGTDMQVTHVLARQGREDAATAVFGPTAKIVTTAADMPTTLDLIVECAGHVGLKSHGPALLRQGHELVTISAGALADPALETSLADAARAGKTQLHIASGAIGALDALSCAATGTLQTVHYTGRKPATGWQGSHAETVLNLATLTKPTPHFNGTARAAATLYPKNANVAAAVALAGIGFDATTAELIADPTTSQNTHEIHATGDFGTLTFTIAGNALPTNPKTSALAAMSIVRAVQKRISPVTV